ncbi:MAG: O-antigen ligase family protein [Candidatus Binatia bacterium]
MLKVCDSIIQTGFIFLIIFTPLAFGAVQPWSIVVMELTVLLMVAAWLLKMIQRRELRFSKTPLNIPLVLFVVLVLFQMFPLSPSMIQYLSPNTYDLYKMTLPNYGSDDHPSIANRLAKNNVLQESSFPSSLNSTNDRSLTIYRHATKTELLEMLAYSAIFFLIVNNLRTNEQIDRLLKTIIVMGFLLSVFAIVQELSGTDKIYWFRELTHGGSPFGPYINRNHFAGYISMVILLALGFLLGLRSKGGRQRPSGVGHPPLGPELRTDRDSPTGHLLLIFALAIMIAALFLSLSRGGIVSFLLGILFLLNFSLFGRKSRKRPYVLVGSVVLSAFLILVHLGIAPVIERLSTISRLEQEASATARTAVWRDTVVAAKDFPLLGTGLGTFQYIFPQYRRHSSDIRLYFDYAHNDYLQLLLETGLVGFILLLGGLTLFLWKSLSRWKQRHDPFVKGVTMGGLAAIVSILFHSLVDFNLHIPANALLFSMIIGVTNNVLCSKF